MTSLSFPERSICAGFSSIDDRSHALWIRRKRRLDGDAGLSLGVADRFAGARYMPIDYHSLVLLLAIAVLSYLFGYLSGQLQFPDSPSTDGKLSRRQTPEDEA